MSRLRQQMGGAGVLFRGQSCLWSASGAYNCEGGCKPPHSKWARDLRRDRACHKNEEGLDSPLIAIIEINGVLKPALGTGRQFSIVCVRVLGRSQQFAKTGHSRVDSLAIDIQKFGVAHLCFEEC